jgi:hypothetical protein
MDPIEAFDCVCGAVLIPPYCGNPACSRPHQGLLQCPDCGGTFHARWQCGKSTRQFLPEQYPAGTISCIFDTYFWVDLYGELVESLSWGEFDPLAAFEWRIIREIEIILDLTGNIDSPLGG